MRKKVQPIVKVMVICLVLVMVNGCSEKGKKPTPTDPLDSISLTNLVAVNASSSQGILPDGIIDLFDVPLLPTTLTGATLERGGRAISASQEQGFLCYGQYRTDYPGIPLRAVFSVLIDNHTANDEDILVLDIYDYVNNKILAQQKVARRDFLQAYEYSIFEIDFIPPVGQSALEFRIYSFGRAYICANKIAIINPAQISTANIIDIIKMESDTGGSSGTPPVESTLIPTATPEPGFDGSQEDSGYCTGNEILCLPEMTEPLVAQYSGTIWGGSFQNGQYLSSPNGGIIVPLTINVERAFTIEFEIEGNIANWRRAEHAGGKVSLLTLEGIGNDYYAALQRMPEEYRGGGIFRLILGDCQDILDRGGAFLMTHASLAGAYSMGNWGTEPHKFKIVFDGNRCQMDIDSYQSNFSSAPYSISGQRQINLVIGNREPEAFSRGEGAITRFRRFKIQYQ